MFSTSDPVPLRKKEAKKKPSIKKLRLSFGGSVNKEVSTSKYFVAGGYKAKDYQQIESAVENWLNGCSEKVSVELSVCSDADLAHLRSSDELEMAVEAWLHGETKSEREQGKEKVDDMLKEVGSSVQKMSLLKEKMQKANENHIERIRALEKEIHEMEQERERYMDNCVVLQGLCEDVATTMERIQWSYDYIVGSEQSKKKEKESGAMSPRKREKEKDSGAMSPRKREKSKDGLKRKMEKESPLSPRRRREKDENKRKEKEATQT